MVAFAVKSKSEILPDMAGRTWERDGTTPIQEEAKDVPTTLKLEMVAEAVAPEVFPPTLNPKG